MVKSKDMIKEKIMKVAIKNFSEVGFHGTSIRHIAAEVGCSLPTIYYYFESKEKMFEKIVFEEFMKINQAWEKRVDLSDDPRDLYVSVIMHRLKLRGHERRVYRLALKIWFGYDGPKELREKIVAWEESRFNNNREFLNSKYAGTPNLDSFIRVLIALVENYMLKNLLLDEAFTQEEVEKKIYWLFDTMGI